MAKPTIIKVPASFGTVTNSTAETVLGTVTLPAFSVKSRYRINAFALAVTTATNSTDTFALKLKQGSTVLSTVTAFDATDDDVCFIEFKGSIDADNELLHGVAFDGRTGAALANPEPSADVAFNTDAAVVYTVTGTWSVASADNIAVLKDFYLELQPVD
jgi:hypothetical protein